MNAIRSKWRKSSYPPALLSDAAAICSMVEYSARDTDLSDISGDPTVTSDSSQSSILDDTNDSMDSIVRYISRRRHEDNLNQDRVDVTLSETLDDSTLPLQLFNSQNSRIQEVHDQLRSMCSICNKVNAFISLAEQDKQRSSSLTVSTASTAVRPLVETTSYRRLSPQDQNIDHLFSSIKWSVVKISNIPWDISVSQIAVFFQDFKLPQQSVHSHSIHIMVDRSSGKTLSNAFVELKDQKEAHHAVASCNRKPLKGRLVHVSMSSQDELLNAIFPSWSGDFQDGMAIRTDDDTVPSKLGHTFITRQEINSLLTICRNYKIHFSRKCPERPFENVMSIVCKYPWYQPDLVTALQRDHIYECLKLAIECLCSHIVKDYITIDPTLLGRMVRTGIMCPTFTERQQTVILNASGQECPEDAKPFIFSDRPRNTNALTNEAPSGMSDSEEDDTNKPSGQCSPKAIEMPPQKSEVRTWDDCASKNLIDLNDDNVISDATINHQQWQSSLAVEPEHNSTLKHTDYQYSLSINSNNHSFDTTYTSVPSNQLIIEERINLLCQQLKSHNLKSPPLT
ncbi:hypothetical protein NQZ79_g8199 [Umbelopsis isabellina]|nr:hypothetical protein NQZ79_g8199 [Umbelopsis isabellina]